MLVIYYRFSIQFVSSKAPSFSQIDSLIGKAVKEFNKKSLIARNRKQIVGIEVIDDTTLILILESSIELAIEHCAKSLRVFSTELINDPTMSSYIVGGKLFKMRPKKLENYIPVKIDLYKNYKEKSAENVENIEINTLAIIEKCVEIIKKGQANSKPEDKVKLIELINILNN